MTIIKIDTNSITDYNNLITSRQPLREIIKYPYKYITGYQNSENESENYLIIIIPISNKLMNMHIRQLTEKPK